MFNFHSKGCPIPCENTTNDTGIIVSKDLTYCEHVNKIIAECYQRFIITKNA